MIPSPVSLADLEQSLALFQAFDFLDASGNVMVIFTDGEDTTALTGGRRLDDILESAIVNNVPLYFVRTNYDKRFGDLIPDQAWMNAVAKTGGKFYAVGDEADLLRAIEDIDRVSTGALLASALLVLAMAQPQVPTAVPQRAGLDVIVLQDASASMRVRDAATGDRWQRSMQFLRQLGDALRWHDDRVAMVSFAHVATPQIRLPRDPNTLFFFLNHLHSRPPFRLEDDTTWDTNLEEAIGWGLRVVEKDEEIRGRSRNGAVFLMRSDGESWSGEVARAVQRAVDRGIPLYVVGVGSLGGGLLPVVRLANGELLASPGTSRLERAALQRIAAAGRGAYFELDRDGDRHIANTIVAAGRRLAPAVGLTEVAENLHWWFVVAATVIVGLGSVFLQRVPLGMLLAGSLGTALALGPVLW